VTLLSARCEYKIFYHISGEIVGDFLGLGNSLQFFLLELIGSGFMIYEFLGNKWF